LEFGEASKVFGGEGGADFFTVGSAEFKGLEKWVVGEKVDVFCEVVRFGVTKDLVWWISWVYSFKNT